MASSLCGTVGSVSEACICLCEYMHTDAVLACHAAQAFYRQSSRELRRLSSVARSPVYAGFSEAIDGAPTIRGFSAQAAFSQQNIAALETLQRANYAGALN